MSSELTKADNVQRLIQKALNYYLYSSFSGFNRPLRLQMRIESQPLLAVEAAMQGGESRPGRTISPREFAFRLAAIYRDWSKSIPDAGEHAEELPAGSDYRQWRRSGGSARRYGPVHFLQAYVEAKGRPFFAKAIVHGSVGTLDDEPGFSDLDLALVVRSSVLQDEKALLRLRRTAAVVLAAAYAFDPYMHHGPFYISEIDLTWYPQPFLPTVVFQHGVELLNDSPRLKVAPREASEITAEMIEGMMCGFRRFGSSGFQLHNTFEIESYLGTTMILPTLFLQRLTGKNLYKRDSFPEARKFFTEDQWEPIRTASLVRKSLPPRPTVPRRMFHLSRLAKFPYWLFRWGRGHASNGHRAGLASEVVGDGFALQVVRLLEEMKLRIDAAPRGQE